MIRRRSNRKRRLTLKALASGEEPPDPFITPLLVTGVIIGAAGTAFGAVAASQSAKAQSAMAQSNAWAAERDAQFATAQAKYNEDLSRQRSEKIRGSQRAAIGAAGLDFSGSPMDLLEETAVQSEIEALNIRAMGQFQADSSRFQAAGSRLQADAYRKQGNTALTSGLLSAGGQLASGLGTAAYNHGQMKRAQQGVY